MGDVQGLQKVNDTCGNDGQRFHCIVSYDGQL
jgi:hypothetical protein